MSTDADRDGDADAGADPEGGQPGAAPSSRHGPAIRRLSEWDDARLVALADDHGTPLYVTDLDRVRENYRRFDEAFGDARVMYAAKANTGRAVLRAVHDAGADVECAAAGELERAIRAGIPTDDLRYTAVNPPAADLEYVVSLWAEEPSLTVTVGAASTAERLAARGFDGRVAIRVNPGIGTGHHEKVATGKDAKFGVPHEAVPDLASTVADRFDLVGLHMHVGSGILGEDLADHRRAVGKLAAVARDVEAELGDGALEFVDVGGGFGVPYREDDPPLDLGAAARATREALGDVGDRVRLELEPGRYVVADASVLLGRVNTRKETPSGTVIGMDASMTQLVRPAMFGSYHPIRNLSGERDGRESEPVALGGPICSSADVFATDRPMARGERGDVVAVGNAGAYGYELASQFHSQPRPAEVALENGETRVVRRRETFDDLTRLEDEAGE
jgi:diaminopimelate decarboxylase